MNAMIDFTKIVSPQDLTTCVLEELLNVTIDSIKWKPIESAIMSQVLELEITLADDGTTKAYIVKCLKPSLPLSEMFRVEGEFYSSLHLPEEIFGTPQCLASGPRFLLLEKVPDIQTYTLLQGCPSNYIKCVITRLAKLHVHYWGSSSLGTLSAKAGIGSALTGLQKEQLFAQYYPTFCPDWPDCQTLCQSLNDADSSIAQLLHDRVHAFQPTLIHGDMHVGNLLFGTTATNSKTSSIYLIDWATCGAGNPMRDLVFFFVVSTNGISITTVRDEWLPLYHEELTTSGTKIQISLADLWDHFLDCLVNQFIILVCYDETVRNLLRQHDECPPHVEIMYNQHFDNVNQRCAQAILDFGIDNLYQTILTKNKKATTIGESIQTTTTRSTVVEEPTVLKEI